MQFSFYPICALSDLKRDDLPRLLRIHRLPASLLDGAGGGECDQGGGGRGGGGGGGRSVLGENRSPGPPVPGDHE